MFIRLTTLHSHRTVVVNINHISRIYQNPKDQAMIYLMDGTELEPAESFSVIDQLITEAQR